MSKLVSKFLGFLTSRTLAGVDKTGNRYFARKETIDGIVKEKRFVVFKGEEDPTSIPVEWICWLNGQRKKAPTPQEIIELEERREQVKLKVALLKKEEKKSTGGSFQQSKSTDKVGPPDLKSFIQQFPGASFGHNKGCRFCKTFAVNFTITLPSKGKINGGCDWLASPVVHLHKRLRGHPVRDMRKHRVQRLTPLIKTGLRNHRDLVVLSNLGHGSRQRERSRASHHNLRIEKSHHNLRIEKFRDDASDLKLVSPS